jgi:hypothetical protein
MRRDPAKAVQVLDTMLEFFDGGRRWTRGTLCDQYGERRCLIGALRYVRQQQHIRGAGTEHYLRHAMISGVADDLDPLSDLWVFAIGMPGDGDLMRYNDVSADYDEVREVILEARSMALAELDAKRARRRCRSSKLIQSDIGTSRRATTESEAAPPALHSANV